MARLSNNLSQPFISDIFFTGLKVYSLHISSMFLSSLQICMTCRSTRDFAWLGCPNVTCSMSSASAILQHMAFNFQLFPAFSSGVLSYEAVDCSSVPKFVNTWAAWLFLIFLIKCECEYCGISLQLHVRDSAWACCFQINLPVVPHKAVAEVSKIGNL